MSDSHEVIYLNSYSFVMLNRMYSVYVCSPTVTTCTGGDRQPKILTEVNE